MHHVPSRSESLRAVKRTVLISRPATRAAGKVHINRSFGTLSVSQGDLGQEDESISQQQPHDMQQESPGIDARSAALYACLDSCSDDDDSIYQAADRATDALFQWRDEVAFSSTPISPPTPKEFDAILLAWTKIPHVRGVPQRAERILDVLEREGEHAATIDSYNHVLHTWAHSGEHMRGTMAQNLFQKLTVNSSRKKSLKADGATFRTMMYAWANSGEVKAAFRATGHLMKLLYLLKESDGDVDLQPHMEDYYLIFDAWTSARDKQAAEKSLNVLRLMEEAYIDRLSELRADIRIYRSILKAFARSPSSPNLGLDVDRLLTKIWDRNLVPDTDCFSYAINTFANCALHKDLTESPWPLASRAHQLLLEMVRAVQKSETVQVSTDNYNTVLTAFTAAPEFSSDPALELLDKMEDNLSMARPNAATYALVVNILAKSPTVKDKVTLSQQVIQRGQREFERGNETAKPDLFIYNAFIRACAASTSDTASQREATLRLALQTLPRDIRGNNLKPDPETFLCLLEASSSLLPPGASQTKALDQIDRKSVV